MAAQRNADLFLPIRSRNKVWMLFEAYRAEVEASGLAPSSKNDYVMFAEMFVRWIEGEFVPGASLRDAP